MEANQFKMSAAQETAYRKHRAGLVEQCSLLAQMKEKAGADATFAAELQSLMDNANSQLAKLPPLEQVPAAMELSSAINWAICAWENASEYCKTIFDRLKEASAKLADATSELSSLKKKVADGELIEKAKHTEACATAEAKGKKDATDAYMPEIISSRKAMIEANKWPVPSDDILGKPAAEFNAAVDALKANLAAAKAKKMELNGRGDKALRANLWKPTAEFNTAIEQVEDLISNTPAQRTHKPNPALGGSRTERNEAPEDGVKPKRHGLFPLGTPEAAAD